MKFIKFNLCLTIVVSCFSKFSYAQVNCSNDFNNGVNLIIQADRFESQSISHDDAHEKFLLSHDIHSASNELSLSIENSINAINTYQQAKNLLEGVVEFRCWRKVRKSNKKLSYIEWKLSRNEVTLENLQLMKSYL